MEKEKKKQIEEKSISSQREQICVSEVSGGNVYPLGTELLA